MVKQATPRTRQLRSLAGRIGGYRKAALYDARQATLPAREAFARRFLDQVDPERTLPEPERLRRAEAARRAHFARLALLSAMARRGRREGATRPPDPAERLHSMAEARVGGRQ